MTLGCLRPLKSGDLGLNGLRMSFLELVSLKTADATLAWPAWTELSANREQGRVIGISTSIFLLIFCYWITTLKVRWCYSSRP